MTVKQFTRPGKEIWLDITTELDQFTTQIQGTEMIPASETAERLSGLFNEMAVRLKEGGE